VLQFTNKTIIALVCYFLVAGVELKCDLRCASCRLICLYNDSCNGCRQSGVIKEVLVHQASLDLSADRELSAIQVSFCFSFRFTGMLSAQ